MSSRGLESTYVRIETNATDEQLGDVFSHLASAPSIEELTVISGCSIELRRKCEEPERIYAVFGQIVKGIRQYVSTMSSDEVISVLHGFGLTDQSNKPERLRRELLAQIVESGEITIEQLRSIINTRN